MSSPVFSANELRSKFLKFFEERGHKVIPPSSLVPENDPTVLFTTAGMHPLVPYITGEFHPEGKRLVNIQPCLRTDDIEEVGDTYHHTFFEMMGNWSLGDYWKEDAIKWSWEFLTQELKIDKNEIAISCFAGDSDASRDDESAKIWKSLGVSENRIKFLGKKDNWWGPAGQTGPCGPDTEMFVWVGEGEPPEEFTGPEDTRWVEVWNDVFMEYDKKLKVESEKLKGSQKPEYEFVPLAQKNVDTGMGFERMLAVLSGTDDDYKTELFWPIIQKIEELTGCKYNDEPKTIRRIADHRRATIEIIKSGILPGKNGRESVLRTLLRVIFVEIKYLMQKDDESYHVEPGIDAIGLAVRNQFKDYSKIIEQLYGAVDENIRRIVMREYSAFLELETSGMRFFKENIHKDMVTGEDIFKGKDTFGLGPEAVVEILRKFGGKKIEQTWEENYKIALDKHREVSRAGAGQFKGGLADAKEETTKLHTAAHLLHATLRKVLGEHVLQKGSNITAERLRFDFSHTEKLTEEQIKQVEDLVNEQIQKNLPVEMEEMTVDEAKKSGALGVFDERYGNRVKVYTIGPSMDSTSSPQASSGTREFFSREICGGPHAKSTGKLGTFKITNEMSSSAGIRRIKAVLE